MKAAVFHGPQKPLTIENVDIAKPIGREVLVRTVASGVCHSDLHFVDGYYPFPAPAILGHEAAGLVQEVGPHVTEFKAGDHVIACLSVFCGGGVGLAAIQGARSAGAGMIIAVDVFESKLAKARELGATHAIDATKGDPVKAIRELTNGGVEYSFEAIGLKKAAEQAFECIRPGGTATVIGMIPVGQKLELEGSVFLREKRIQGCSMGSNRFKVDMPKYVDFYQRGLLRLDEMITRRGRLEDVNDAFRAMKAGEVARTVLMFD